MLRINTAVSGYSSRMRRVATAPFILTSAKSITTTCGFRTPTASTASCPSLASPTTRTTGASSSRRRNPVRTKLWSSTSRTEISGSGMGHLRRQWHRHAHQHSALIALGEFDGAIHQPRPFAHRDQAQTLRELLLKSDALVLHLEHNCLCKETQPHRRALGLRMPGDVVQRFLNDAIEVNGNLPVQFAALARLLITYFNSRLPFEYRQVCVQRALEACLVENHGMQGVR